MRGANDIYDEVVVAALLYLGWLYVCAVAISQWQGIVRGQGPLWAARCSRVQWLAVYYYTVYRLASIMVVYTY
jgi:hypothetical protein